MKKINYILLIVLGIFALNSCEDSDALFNQIEEGVNLVVWENNSQNLVGLADDSEYDMQVPVKLTGPSLEKVSGDITVTVAAASTSTAEAGKHYRIENPTITLKASNNYLGMIDVVLVTLGNKPPDEDSPEFDDYVAPVLDLEMTSVSGSNVVGTGIVAALTLNYTPFNPYAGDYIAHTIYRHPSVGTYPDNINVEADYNKTIGAITGSTVSCDWFAVWEGVPIVFKVGPAPDYLITDFSVDLVAWGNPDEDIQLGDPFDASKISHFDPITRKIYLYYHYCRSSGCRVFWEEYTPQF